MTDTSKQLKRPSRNPNGRPKGSQNEITQGAKQNIMEVFEMLGGAKGFYEWASENRSEFYRHYAKLLPTDVKLEGSLTVGLSDVVGAIQKIRSGRDS